MIKSNSLVLFVDLESRFFFFFFLKVTAFRKVQSCKTFPAEASRYVGILNQVDTAWRSDKIREYRHACISDHIHQRPPSRKRPAVCVCARLRPIYFLETVHTLEDFEGGGGGGGDI